ncbi:PrsW family intramembrane metalloprotease [Zhihengliuella salsuginis]|uniref:Protease PrsW n=1 Tax=Zhihengliuella salsuginis TaxID=578222 RepID=A0ABQ3GN65_9MICC|nr:PrsW family intramembrane metalloprotease [Zhihengliuella salsuginis]GHD11930.1 protease PrsW [Zhihengliuella salsuginis]
MSASAPPVPRSVAPPPHLELPPFRERRRHHLRVMGLLLLALAVFVGAVFWLAQYIGQSTMFVVGLLALVPLGICLLGLRWIDRWDPEPAPAVLFAAFWGAGASVLGTLLFGEPFARLVMPMSVFSDPEVFGAVVQAPILEEAFKGIGVLLVFYVARWHFDGPVDGIVYGGLVGAGFAFTENILYFSSAWSTAPSELAGMFVMRGLFSPFAHVMFTSCLGFFLGLSAVKGRRRSALWFAVPGYIVAVLGHFLWNGGLTLLFDSFLSFYVTLQLPLFAAAVGGVMWLRRAERRRIHGHLLEYSEAGWLTSDEAQLFGTPTGRRQAVRWARARGAAPQLRQLTRTAVRLAEVRHRICVGHDVQRQQAREERLLVELARDRGGLLRA